MTRLQRLRAARATGLTIATSGTLVAGASVSHPTITVTLAAGVVAVFTGVTLAAWADEQYRPLRAQAKAARRRATEIAPATVKLLPAPPARRPAPRRHLQAVEDFLLEQRPDVRTRGGAA